MSPRSRSHSLWLVCALSAAALAACGESTGDGGGDSGNGGAATGGTAPSGGTATGGQPPTGGVSGIGQTGGSGSGTGGSTGATGGTGLTGGAGPTGGAAGAGAVGGTGIAGSGSGMGGAGGATGGAGGSGGSAAGKAGSGGSGGSGGSAGAPSCGPKATGWASVSGMGFGVTTGGCNATPVIVTTLAQLNTALAGAQNKVVRVQGTITGTVNVTTNTTLEGAAGAIIRGSVVVDSVVNVIVRNLTIVGNNCASPDTSDCEAGHDALSINGGSHHVWVDHCDISNGSDGNLDVVDASDFVTVSWTKFSYSGTGRTHRFSNLVGDGDGESTDAGRLGVTFDHCWWADRVQERMPRVRYGRVHIFNSLYTSSGNNHCVALGYNGNIRLENNVFVGVADPINSTDYNPNTGTVTSTGNVYTSTTGSTANDGTAWTPTSIAGYAYTLQPTTGLQAAVQAGARPQP